MWYIMQSIQSKYSLSERLIRTIAAIRSFPHDNVEDLIRGVSGLLLAEQASEVGRGRGEGEGWRDGEEGRGVGTGGGTLPWFST
jgi:hypothetical protein